MFYSLEKFTQAYPTFLSCQHQNLDAFPLTHQVNAIDGISGFTYNGWDDVFADPKIRRYTLWLMTYSSKAEP